MNKSHPVTQLTKEGLGKTSKEGRGSGKTETTPEANYQRYQWKCTGSQANTGVLDGFRLRPLILYIYIIVQKLHQHRPQTATNHVSTTFMCNKEFIGHPIPEKRNERKEGRQAPEPEPEPEGTRKSRWNTILFLRKERQEK